MKRFYFSRLIALRNFSVACAVPLLVLVSMISYGQNIAGGGNTNTVCAGTANVIIYSFSLAQTSTINFTGFNFTTTAGATTTTSSYYAYYAPSTGNSLTTIPSNAYYIGAVSNAGPGTQTFTSWASVPDQLLSGTTYYFYIVANILNTATPGATISVSPVTTSNIITTEGAGTNTATSGTTTVATALSCGCTQYYSYNGNPIVTSSGTAQSYVVPAGCTQLSVQVSGARGADGKWNPYRSQGGNGGTVTTTLNVVPSSTLYIYVGNNGDIALDNGSALSGPGGSNSGGGAQGGNGSFYEGGGGGGETDIRTSNTGDLTTRCVMGAGGGGGGYGSGSSSNNQGGIGANGAGAGGGDGLYLGSYNSSECGAPGTFTCCAAAASLATGGALGAGGACNSGYYGGGGGGGYYGASGGYFGGACGGSSYAQNVTGITVGAITYADGNNPASGSVIITPGAPVAYAVTGGGATCVGSGGAHVGLANSLLGVSYQLQIGGVNTGSPITGTGSALDFGPQSAIGVYTVIAYYTAYPGCTFNQTGSATTFSGGLAPTITGTQSVCSFATTNLSATPTGGTWVSGNTAQATVGSSSGTVTGGVPGTSSITYTTTGGCTVAATVTVNAGPAPITGTASVCASGGTTSLGEISTGGTWSTSIAGIASISPAGLLTGVSAGTSTISYTFSSTGCLSTVVATVNGLPTPYPVIATAAAGLSSSSYCFGSASTIHIELGSSTAGVRYQLFDATTAGTTALPAIISSGGLLDFGLQSNVGTYTAIATNISATPNCTVNMVGSASISVTALPPVLPVSASSNGLYCASGSGVSITVNGSTLPGDTYKLYNGGSSPVISEFGSGGSLTFTGLYPTGSYTVVASDASTNHCSSTMNSGTPVNVTSEPLPSPQTIIVDNGGYYCNGTAGLHVGLAFSNSGVVYSLYNSTGFVDSVVGSNSGLDFGLQTAPGIYTVVATNQATRCSSNMPGSITITINYAPNSYSVLGGGGYCPGTVGDSLALSSSDLGVTYQLYNGTIAVGGPVTGTGNEFNFGTSFTTSGTYLVTATSVAGCKDTMAGNPSISPNTAPTAYPVFGGGPYCAGGSGDNISIGGGDFGVNYQLLLDGIPFGLPQTGAGSPINFGTFYTGGIYTVVANNGSCSTNMTGSAVIVVNPLPTSTYSVTGTGGYCSNIAGRHVGLSYSDAGVEYFLYNTSGLVDSVAGSGSGLDFGVEIAGSYTVVAVNEITRCSADMTGSAVVNMNSLPNSTYNVTPGTGDYCAGGAGVDIGLSGSDANVNYQLFLGTSPVGSAVAGAIDGGPIDFGFDTAAGTYTVVGTNPSTTCTSNMTGSAVITIDPLPTVYTLSAPGGANYCSGGAGVDLVLSGSATGINYQLNLDGGADTLLAGTGSSLDFGMQPNTGSYTVVATNPSTTCTSNMAGSPIVNILPLPPTHNVTGGGNYCMGGTGSVVGLDGSDAGIHYQLLFGGLPVGSVLSGSGASLNFGLRAPVGTYTVLASNPVTTCTVDMAGSATVGTITLPIVYSVSGGGPYCAGTTPSSVFLGSSDEGITYMLYLGSTFVDSVAGGSAIDFGPQAAAGTYTVIGTGLTSRCSQNMAGDAIITVNTVNAYAVIGGGAYCQGGTGVHIGQGSSTAGVDYQLMNGGTNIGTPVIGTGGPIDFGLDTLAGTYTVIGTNATTECTADMAGSATVTINSLPNLHSVTGGGNFCAGSSTGDPIGINATDEGVNYQVYHGTAMVGGPVSGTGLAITDIALGSDSGAYTIVATNATTGCSSNMLGNAVVIVKPLPTPYPVTAENYGNYCAGDTGVHIGLANSNVGVTYQLSGGSASAPITITASGTGAALDFGLQVVAGTYIVTASDASTSCDNTMSGSANVYIIPLPVVHNVTGTGGYCPGGAGVDVGLDGSQAGIYYQLYDAGVPVGSEIYGTGVALNFGVQPAGVYTIVGNSQVIAMGYVTTCPNPMFGSATITVDSLLTPSVTLQAYPGPGVGVWHIDSMKVFVTNGGTHPTFQWLVNGNIIAGATSATFSNYDFFNGDSVSCIVTASGPCGGLSKSEYVVLALHNVGVTQVTSAGNDIKLVPNPNKGQFVVKGALGVTTDQEVSLEVTNMLGQVVYSNKVLAQGGNIDASVDLGSSLANGMYIMTVHSGTQNNVLHFVIER